VLTTDGFGVASWSTPAGGVTTAGTNVTITGVGTVGDPYVVNAAGYACGLSIGDTYQGGIIFYLDASGCHGLMAAPNDQSTGISWNDGEDTRARADGLGAGLKNTIIIIAKQQFLDDGFAAGLCNEYSTTDGGVTYGDWYLPSDYELALMYQNIGPGNALGLGNIGGFTSSYYWSSTEYDAIPGFALRRSFTNGDQYFNLKSNNNDVRAVRAF
jgi:hypothetical protein